LWLLGWCCWRLAGTAAALHCLTRITRRCLGCTCLCHFHVWLLRLLLLLLLLLDIIRRRLSCCRLWLLLALAAAGSCWGCFAGLAALAAASLARTSTCRRVAAARSSGALARARGSSSLGLGLPRLARRELLLLLAREALLVLRVVAAREQQLRAHGEPAAAGGCVQAWRAYDLKRLVRLLHQPPKLRLGLVPGGLRVHVHVCPC
jgi:hypothetical protein